MSTIDTTLPGMAIKAGATDREKLKATAKQFESMLVRQMLAAARKTDFGGDDVFGSQAMDTFRQMQDEHFADVTAETGVLGLASILEAQMQRFLPADETQPGQSAAATQGKG